MASSAVEVQFADSCGVDLQGLPNAVEIRRWARQALTSLDRHGSVAIRVMGEEEMRSLNSAYRGKTGTTNVLSFPPGESPATDAFLGDIAICAPVVLCEARAQGKRLEAHFSHLIVHGVLHLLGYDHESEAEAAVMEGKEVEILAQFGVSDPYAAERSAHD